ncbi:GGDEF domain-containing protein [Desulfotruncus alcoholivorax]|uniref:GGDEF domain-containing protein n=1 Tax=Desulfotruncus alcoholivorax TaxID=265477 RepID=UPI00042639FC|nr:GGDEF domain-containing protein [Desulfotruncus alcoholivorax]
MKVKRKNKGKLYGTVIGLSAAVLCITYCYLLPQMWPIYVLSLLYIPIGMWIGCTYDRINHLASFDSLTGAANRRMLIQMLHKHLTHADKNGAILSIIYIDVDKFKQINDRYGHDQGDLALQIITRTIEANVRSTDVVGRIGGDEFVILCPGLSKAKSADLVQRIKKAVAHQAREYPLSVSAGISVYPEDGRTADVLLCRADETMYRSKAKKAVHR